MSTNDNENNETLRGCIRQLIGSVATTRYMRALPAFRVENDVAEFQSLLQAIDQSERKPATSSRRSG